MTEATETDKKQDEEKTRPQEKSPRPEDRQSDTAKDGDSKSSKKKNSEEGDEKKEKRPKRPSKKVLIIGGIILVLLIIVGVIYYLHARHFESTDDAYTAGHIHEVSARIAGTVVKIGVDDNQFVRQGQTLLLLDPSNYQLALEKAQAQLAQAQAQVTDARAGVEQKRAAALRAKANLEKAQNDYQRATSLYRQDVKAVSQADVDTATAALHSAESENAAASADIAAAEARVATAEAGIATAKSGLHDAQLQLSYTRVLAPVDGRVGKKNVETGQRIQPGQALMAVVEGDIWVLANLKETQLAKVKIGQKVSIDIDAIPDKTFQGHIDSFQPGSGATFSLLPPDNATGNFTKIVQRVPVKIVFEPDSIRGYQSRLIPGLSCAPTIDLRTK